MSSGQGPKAMPGTGKTSSKGDRFARLGMDYSAQASSSKATADQGHTVSSKRPLSEPTSSDEETQHKPERKQPKIISDLTMEEDDIEEGETVESGTTEQPSPAPGMETEAPDESSLPASLESMYSKFRDITSTDDDTLDDFVSVLEKCLPLRPVCARIEFITSIGNYVYRKNVLDRLIVHDGYNRLLHDVRCLPMLVSLLHVWLRAAATRLRGIEDVPPFTKEAVHDLHMSARAARELGRVKNAREQRIDLSYDTASNNHNAVHRQRPLESSNESTENRQESVTYPSSITAAPIAQMVRLPATGLQSPTSKAHNVAKTSESSSNTSSAIGRPPPYPKDPSRTYQ